MDSSLCDRQQIQIEREFGKRDRKGRLHDKRRNTEVYFHRPTLTPSRDQDHRYRKKVRACYLNPGLVRIGRRGAVPAAGAGIGYAVVYERAQRTYDTNRCARRGGGISGRSSHRRQTGFVRRGKIPRQVRRERREEVLLEVRRRRPHPYAMSANKARSRIRAGSVGIPL